MSENYAEIHARPGEHVGAFYARCVVLAGVIDGTVYGVHNGVTVDAQANSDPDQVVREWARIRELFSPSRRA